MDENKSAEYSAIPWSAGQRFEYPGRICISDDNRKVLAETQSDNLTAVADAVHLVTSANMHHALLGALQTIIAELHGLSSDPDSHTNKAMNIACRAIRESEIASREAAATLANLLGQSGEESQSPGGQDDEFVYLTNSLGEETGNGDVHEEDLAKVNFDYGSGAVLVYLVERDGKKYALGNLELAYKDAEWWGENAEYPEESEVRAYCKAACRYIRARMPENAQILPLDDGAPGRITIGVAVDLSTVQSCDDTGSVFAQSFGDLLDIPGEVPHAAPNAQTVVLASTGPKEVSAFRIGDLAKASGLSVDAFLQKLRESDDYHDDPIERKEGWVAAVMEAFELAYPDAITLSDLIAELRQEIFKPVLDLPIPPGM